MKVNGIDMESACSYAWEQYVDETWGSEEWATRNEFEKINKKELFDQGFSACLKILFQNIKEQQPKGVIVQRD